MEEKKITKISLSTFFLILAIILIILMGFFLFKLYNEKTELSEKSIKQNEKMSDLQNNIDNLTSQLNQISTSITTENAKNNTSSNTQNNASSNTTEEKQSNFQLDLSTYLGLWEKSTSNEHLYLHLYSIDNNEITFDFTYNGKNIGEIHNKATLNGNTASFVINEGNNSLTGKMTLDNKNIIMNIIDSTFDNISKGTITFSNYLGLQN